MQPLAARGGLTLKCLRDPRDDTDGILEAVFPDADDAPTGLAQFTVHEAVTCDVAGHLLRPERAPHADPQVIWQSGPLTGVLQLVVQGGKNGGRHAGGIYP